MRAAIRSFYREGANNWSRVGVQSLDIRVVIVEHIGPLTVCIDTEGAVVTILNIGLRGKHRFVQIRIVDIEVAAGR